MKKRDVTPRINTTPQEIFGVYWTHLVQRNPTLPLQVDLATLDALILLNEGSDFQDELRQAKALISKVPGSGAALKQAALKTWYECEDSCRTANINIPLINRTSNPPLNARLEVARNLILRTIGEFTPRKYKQILRLAKDGPGVSLGTRDRSRTAPVYKALKEHTRQTVTSEARHLAVDYYKDSLSLIQRELEVKDGCYVIETTPSNRVGFVPKSAKTLRSIAIEPSVNLRFQLGVHQFLADLLERKHVAYIEDQRPNQLLAKLSSVDGSSLHSFATIDLRSASDTISRELVKRLLPESWYDFLDVLRCKSSIVEGKSVELEKFSSMGNGFTFVLETLIFWSLSESCRLESNAPLLTLAYGDDIICPTQSALLLVETLTEVGLSVNSEKSFFFGSFRESCGADWRHGRLVTPVYLKSRWVSIQDVHRVVNHFGAIARNGAVKNFLLERYAKARPLIFGLENEDPSSCIFTSLGYLRGIGQAKFHSPTQNWRFQGLMTSGTQYEEGDEISCLSALLGGARSTPCRGRVKTRLRWMTAGRPAGVQLLMS